MNADAGRADIGADVRGLCALAAELSAETEFAAEVTDLGRRLDEPLRIAIAGRAKAGKSTLLNALVGERLAPTDAGECTKIVTWYRAGLGYDVQAVLRDGEVRPVPFARPEGRLAMDLTGLAVEHVERLVVTWPSRALERVTLIDTPGLASLDEASSLRTTDVLAMGQERPSDADAVIYLMRHLHRRDAEFLGAFLDRRVAASSPANAIGVLSRADEIGGARLDAMISARRIADRYQADPQVRSLCTRILPIAGLVAETGLTIREDEVAALRVIAATEDRELEQMLWSVDRFCDPASSAVTIELRRSLLLRLGLFGLRVTIGELQRGRATTATDVSRLLVEASGLNELRHVVTTTFVPRAKVLQARSVLVGLRSVAARLDGISGGPPGGGRRLAAEVERVESGALAFTELRLAHLVLSGDAALPADERAELERVIQPGAAAAERLALAPGATGDALVTAALAGAGRWRGRAGDPLNDGAQREACEAMAHCYEATYLELMTTQPAAT